MVGADAERGVEPELVLADAGDDDLRSSGRARGNDRRHAHMARALDQHDVAVTHRADPRDRTTEWLEHREFFGRPVLAQPVDERPRQQLEVLREPAVQPGALVDRVVVAVDAVPLWGKHDVAHGDAVTLGDAPLRRGLRADLVDAADDLVAGD